jgi:hypothetical protein
VKLYFPSLKWSYNEPPSWKSSTKYTKIGSSYISLSYSTPSHPFMAQWTWISLYKFIIILESDKIMYFGIILRANLSLRVVRLYQKDGMDFRLEARTTEPNEPWPICLIKLKLLLMSFYTIMVARYSCHRLNTSSSGSSYSLFISYRELSGIGIKVTYSIPYSKVSPLNSFIFAPILTKYNWPSKFEQYDIAMSSIRFSMLVYLLSW